MKNIFKILIITLLFTACKDDDTLPVDFDDLIVSGGAFATELSTDGSTNINKLDPTASEFSKSYQLVTPKGGTDISRVDVYVSFDGLNAQADEALLSTVDASNFSSGDNYPEVTIPFNGGSILSALGLSPDALEGGDVFDFRLALTTPEGTFSDVSANFDNQSADHTFEASVVCELAIVPEGTWTIDMQDSYGDGWQPTTANGGGPGIVVTLSDGTIFEIGLCTPYEDPGYACTDGVSSGTRTITIPSGITSAEWVFNGDFWGEMSFQITAPSGNVVASYLAGSAAGPIALNLCNE